MKTKLDEEELDILKSHDNNQLEISKTRKIDLQTAVKSAKNTIDRNSELRIKLTEKDLKNLKLKEMETGEGERRQRLSSPNLIE